VSQLFPGFDSPQESLAPGIGVDNLRMKELHRQSLTVAPSTEDEH